jgi:hypothetical protein
VAIPQHPFFAQLDQYARNSQERVPQSLAAFLKSDSVFAAACFAAGWTQAGLRLARNAVLDPNAPAWAAQLWNKAVGEAKRE